MTKNSGEKNLILSILKSIFLILLVLIQLFILYLLYTSTKQISLYMGVLFGILRIGTILYIMYRNINPAYKIVWIIFIMLFPVAGLLFYIFFGNSKMPKRLKNKIHTIMDSASRFLVRNDSVYRSLKSESEDAYRQAEYLYNTSLYPLYRNSKVEYLNDGEKYFTKMLKDIENAKKYIFIEYFIISQSELWDEVFELVD